MEKLDGMKWAVAEWGATTLGHRRLAKRLIHVSATLVCNATASIPDAFDDWGGAKGMYRFASNKAVSHAGLIDGHARSTVDKCGGRPRLLVIQDTTHCTFSARRQKREDDGLGPVDVVGKGRGFLAHSALAIDPETREPLGLVEQLVWARSDEKRPSDETCAERKLRPRESEKWQLTAASVHRRLAALDQRAPRIVHVFDREGDVFEALEAIDELGDGFIIRAARDRLLETDFPERDYLAEAAAFAPIRGCIDVAIHARPGRSARSARLELRSAQVTLAPPRNRKRVGAGIGLSVVSAVELDPPPGEERICWLLLTREPCSSVPEVVSIVRDYCSRWLIEEFHMALKTGCSLEKRQLHTFARLANVLAILNPIAVHLLALRHLARTQDSLPASVALPPSKLIALRILRPKLPPDPSVRDALRAIAQLGGFLARKGDGEPGWRTLWLGYRELIVAERIVVSLGHGSG